MGIVGDFVERLRGGAKQGSALSLAQEKHWADFGYLVLPGFFSRAVLDGIEREVSRLWDASRHAPSPLVIDLIGSTGARVHLHDAPLEARRQPHKLNDLYLVSGVVRDLVLAPRLVAVLARLLGGAPLVCNTLNFEFGSQQPFHTDSLYMTPPRDLNLAATWIALEECLPQAGPLRFYPGSHKIEPYLFSSGRMTSIDAEMDRYQAYMQQHVERLGLQEERFCARAGDVFIWHSQLYHGGSPIDDPSRSRRSLVTHYYLADDLPAATKVEHTPGGYWIQRAHQPVH